jgi:precorrin-6B methylase 1
LEPSLRANQQKVAVIIATDGESSDGDIATAMAPLAQLPAWVVIRLCTDDEKIINYWNNIDQQLGSKLLFCMMFEMWSRVSVDRIGFGHYG